MYTISSKESGCKFSADELAPLFKYVGYRIESQEALDKQPLNPDEVCEFCHEPFLEGITNGEYLCALDQVFIEMSNDAPAVVPPFFKAAALASVLDGIARACLPGGGDFGLKPTEIWPLWAAWCKHSDAPLWEEDGEPVESPSYEKFEPDDWRLLLDILAEQLTMDRDYALGLGGSNFALFDEQPLSPTPQQFRSARARLLRAYAGAWSSQPAPVAQRKSTKPKPLVTVLKAGKKPKQ